MENKYVAYRTGIDPTDELYQLELCQNYEGFRVLLQDTKGRVYRISFEHMLVFRSTDDGKRLPSLQQLQGTERSYVYCVENSSFVDWFIAENLDAQFKDTGLRYWAIVTPTDWVDVISAGAAPSVAKL